ncbi:unnamed protein product [Trichobilharzia regenti]|nr:unnamed protein product [Trichobilharzia regenti]
MESLLRKSSSQSGVSGLLISTLNVPFICYSNFEKHPFFERSTTGIFCGVKPFECTYCYKGFTRNSDLHKHIDAVHKGLKPFGCEICQRNFSQKSSLKRHIEAIHEDPRHR